MSKYYEARRIPNNASAAAAINAGAGWALDEDHLVLCWHPCDDNELTLLAELLGRSREACRQRYYVLKREPDLLQRTHSARSAWSRSKPRRTRVTTIKSSPMYDNWTDSEEYPREWYA